MGEVRLRKALMFFLQDQYDMGDSNWKDSEQSIIEDLVLISANIVNNDDDGTITCPYINYGCESECRNIDNCKKVSGDGYVTINCHKDCEKVYAEFYENIVMKEED